MYLIFICYWNYKFKITEIQKENHISQCFRVLFQSNMHGEWQTTRYLHPK